MMQTRIRELRKLQRMTLKQLADQLDTTPQTIQRLETDNMTVSLEWLRRIAIALAVPVRDLLPSADTSTPDDRFIAAMRTQLIRARRCSGSELSSLALYEEAGKLAAALLDCRSGHGSWDRVVEEATQVAVLAMRLATDGDPIIRPLDENDQQQTIRKLEAIA